MRSDLLLSVLLALPSSVAGFESVEFSTTTSGASATHRDEASQEHVWVVQPGTTLLNGEATTRALAVSGPAAGSEEFFSNSASGLRVHWTIGRGGTYYEFFYNTPVISLPGSFQIGQAFSQMDASVTYFDLSAGSVPLQYDLTSEVVAIESVMVPAGTYTAIRVDRTLVYSYQGMPISTRVVSVWMVRHLPAIRWQGMQDGVPYTSEMVSHNIVLCGDGTQDGVVDGADVTLYRNALAGGSLSSTALARCTTIAPQGPCDIRDVVVLRREVEGPLQPPGISRACL